jgi:hypothetical protein
MCLGAARLKMFPFLFSCIFIAWRLPYYQMSGVHSRTQLE